MHAPRRPVYPSGGRRGGADPDSMEVVPCFNAPAPQIQGIGLSLLSEMVTGGVGGELYAEALANVLALHILRQHSSLGRRSVRGIGREDSGFSKRSIAEAIDYINDNVTRKLTLEEIAGVAHMSRHHFARSFKAETGLSPHQYVIRRRVERAKTLLTDTRLSISEVAAAVGFSHQSHLASHLGRVLGISPSALRQQGTR